MLAMVLVVGLEAVCMGHWMAMKMLTIADVGFRLVVELEVAEMVDAFNGLLVLGMY